MLSNPKYPVYIISKGRHETRLTSKALDIMGVPFRIVIEPQEFVKYSSVIPSHKILVLPFSNLGQGGIPARNWVWEHSIKEGHERHWIMDDNIRRFTRLNKNGRVQVTTGAGFAAMEAFVDRYTNVPMAGPNYEMFRMDKHIWPAYMPNTRIYSCILLSNSRDFQQRWRGRYNEDTDLSLRFLKAGHCTVLFNAFLCKKEQTMTMKGGNTESLYKLNGVDGRLLMAQSLQQQHPDVCTITRKWGRWQHQVDYRPFKGNKLIRKKGIELTDSIDNFGMELFHV